MLVYKMTNNEMNNFRKNSNFDRKTFIGLILNISFSLFIIGLLIYCLFNKEEITEFGNLFYFYAICLLGFPIWTFFYTKEVLFKRKCYENKEMYLVLASLHSIIDRTPAVKVCISQGIFKDDEYNCIKEIPYNIRSKLMTSWKFLYLKVVDRRQKYDIYDYPKNGECFVVMYLDKKKNKAYFDLYTLDFSFLCKPKKKPKKKYKYTTGEDFEEKEYIDIDVPIDGLKNEENLNVENKTISDEELEAILNESNEKIIGDVEEIIKAEEKESLEKLSNENLEEEKEIKKKNTSQNKSNNNYPKKKKRKKKK